MSAISKAACIGGGVIGAGWIARLAYNGVDVAVFDPAPDARAGIEAVVANAERAYARLTMAPKPKAGRIVHAESIAAAVEDADWIVEAVPERLDVKQAVYAEIEQAAPAGSHHRLLDLRHPADRPAGEDGASGTPARRPSVQSRLSPAAGRARRRAKDVGRHGGEGQGLPFRSRHEAAPHPQGDRGLRRRPPARGGVARGPVARQGRDRHHGRDRRRDPLRLRPALGADGALRDLPDRRRRGGHAALPGAVRAVSFLALDEADGCAGVQRRAGRADRRPVGRAVRTAIRSASWSASATTTSSPSCRR